MKKILIALGILCAVAVVVLCANGLEEDTINQEGTPKSSWSMFDFKDEFGVPTGRRYLATSVSGTFNSVLGSDQPLDVQVQASDNSIDIVLWEYGNNKIESIYGTVTYKVLVLDQNNVKHQLYAYLYDGKPYLQVSNFSIGDYSETALDLLEMFKEDGVVQFYIQNLDDKDNTYSFSIKTDGFADMFARISSIQSDGGVSN